jgi:SAM-dependent methyltransferase
MAISLVGLQLLASLYVHGVLAHRRSVLEIGAQDVFPNQDDIAAFLARLVGFRRDGDTAIDAELLYKSLGFTVYRCIDADGRHHALTFDLNKDIVQDHHFVDQFDLVTNFGTTEHVFDQCRVFQNIHAVCAPKGIMIHEVPFHNWLNHGFYNYQPTFFYDLADANHYELLGIYLGLPNDLMPYSDGMAQRLSNTDTDIDLLVVLQKTSEEPFRKPFKGQPPNAVSLKERSHMAFATVEIPEQFFPGVRRPRADSTADINLMTTKRLAKALLRRIAKGPVRG